MMYLFSFASASHILKMGYLTFNSMKTTAGNYTCKP